MAADGAVPTIVQVGAYDGETGDPLSGFLDRHRARAILLEPQPTPFAALKAKHAGNRDVITLNAAIADVDGICPLYVVDGMTEHDPWWCGQIASFHRDHLLRHQEGIPNLIDRIRVIDVPTISADTLRRRYALDRVDALIVDAEGSDWQIVRNFLDLGIIPQVLSFEWRHLDQRVLAAACGKLAELEYHVEIEISDLIASRQALVDRPSPCFNKDAMA